MKILVIGATGMLGHKMLQILGHEFPQRVYGTLRGSKTKLEKFNFVPGPHLFENVDIEKLDDVISLLSKLKPTFIINCTGITLRKVENADVEKNYFINAFFPRTIDLWCQSNDAKLIHFSTDCVFDGKKGNYLEKDLPTARDVYGMSKFLGEVTEASLTLRLSIVGREIFGKTELIEWFLSQKNKTVSGFSEVYYSGVTTNFVAQEVIRLIKNYPNLCGLYHIASNRISKYELLTLANRIFQNQTEIIKDATKHSDKSLNCDKYVQATKFQKPDWEQMLQSLSEDKLGYL